MTLLNDPKRYMLECDGKIGHPEWNILFFCAAQTPPIYQPTRVLCCGECFSLDLTLQRKTNTLNDFANNIVITKLMSHEPK